MGHFLVAIDGPAGAGKSTIARMVAEGLQIAYVDTGAMFRAIAWKILHEQVSLNDQDAICLIAESTQLEIQVNGIIVDEQLLEDEIRTSNVAAVASHIAKMLNVRRVLLNLQQRIASDTSVVMDGRDIGTKVLPHADVKIFLTASIEERARRRAKELSAKGIKVNIQALQGELRQRDEDDCNRKYAPLKCAEDAFVIDTTHQDIQETTTEILQLCRHKMGAKE